MAVYKEFARFYTQTSWTEYSQRMAERFPALLERLDAHPHTLLDIACGEGTFAVAMAQAGFAVTGVDLSAEMLRFARQRAERERAAVTWVREDMRTLSFTPQFDVVTCWYDSLNYMLTLADLEAVFAGAARALRPGGLFIFDINTIYGLTVIWQLERTLLVHDTPDYLILGRNSFDYERTIATIALTIFSREAEGEGDDGAGWRRIDEEHQERGYPLGEIRGALARVGLQELVCWGSLREFTAPTATSGRVWFVARKE